jgi:hypothetical protein
MIPVSSGVQVWLATGHTDKAKAATASAGAQRHPALGDAPQLSCRSAAPADRSSGADRTPVLRQHEALEDRRRHHRDARCHPAAMVRDRACVEKFSCRTCERITQPPAPFHVIARSFAGPSLLAMILVDKYANHQPFNRQSEHYAREGIELSVSTMADPCGTSFPKYRTASESFG